MKKRTRSNLFIIPLVVIADQLTKYIAKIYHWPITYNYGISFGLYPHFLGIRNSELITILILFLLIFMLWQKSKYSAFNLGLTLIFAGGVSNFLDRLLNKGGVADFIRLGNLGVFNFADIVITAGLFIIIYSLRPWNHK